LQFPFSQKNSNCKSNLTILNQIQISVKRPNQRRPQSQHLIIIHKLPGQILKLQHWPNIVNHLTWLLILKQAVNPFNLKHQNQKYHILKTLRHADSDQLTQEILFMNHFHQALLFPIACQSLVNGIHLKCHVHQQKHQYPFLSFLKCIIRIFHYQRQLQRGVQLIPTKKFLNQLKKEKEPVHVLGML
jgi:hypothetical protein